MTTQIQNGIENQDVPQHQVGLTSSIGVFWPPEDASFDRIKGFYNLGIIRDASTLRELLTKAHELYYSTLSNGSKATRISLRAVIGSEIRDYFSDKLDRSLEALISLDGTSPEFDGCNIIYVGLNHPTRQPLTEELSQYRRNVEDAKKHPLKSPEEIFARANNKGYNLSILTLPQNNPERRVLITQMSSLYERFGWNRADVEAILTNPVNIIAAAIFDGKIVSAGIAELATIPIGRDNLRIAEITEAATLQEHSKNGLYTAVSTALLKEIAQRSKRKLISGGEIDLVYGECNGNAPGVLKTSAIQGRTFSSDTTSTYGFPNRGVLRQHVPISGAPRSTKFNDLFPSYINRTKLYQGFG